jgi:hypothetical protein
MPRIFTLLYSFPANDQNREVHETMYVEGTEAELDALEAELEKTITDACDGNDSWYELETSDPGHQVTPDTARRFVKNMLKALADEDDETEEDD